MDTEESQTWRTDYKLCAFSTTYRVDPPNPSYPRVHCICFYRHCGKGQEGDEGPLHPFAALNPQTDMSLEDLCRHTLGGFSEGDYLHDDSCVP